MTVKMTRFPLESKKVYEVLVNVPSSSNPDKLYEIRLGSDSKIYCTCPAWRFSKAREKGCKHVRAVAPQYQY
jgi:hypothetical protein